MGAKHQNRRGYESTEKHIVQRVGKAIFKRLNIMPLHNQADVWYNRPEVMGYEKHTGYTRLPDMRS